MACIIVSASAQANQGFKFEDAGSFYGGLADVKINGKYGFIDKRGKLIAPAIRICRDFFGQRSDGSSKKR